MMTLALLSFIALAVSVHSLHSDSVFNGRESEPVVKTSSGRIHGFVDTGYPSVSQFLKIPFAQPPLGDLRFAPPEPLVDSAHNDIDASSYGPVCTQYNPLAARGVLYNVYNQNYLPKNATAEDSSEDCLTLAIQAPLDACKGKEPANPLPVLVWFFGGGFIRGGINTTYYNAAPWIERTKSHIVVAVNYRTNLLGTPNSAGLAAQGKNLNVGLLDQRLAVEWVRDNIANFGGDASRITIWGQSAGSISVDLYNFAYPDDSLITGFIASSGTSLYPRSNIDPVHSNFSYAASQLGCPTEDPTTELECMRQVPSQRIKDLIQDPYAPFTLDYYPVDDNVTKFPISTYAERLASGQFSKVPAILGSASHEGNANIPLIGPQFPNATWMALSDSLTHGAFLCPALTLASLRSAADTTTYQYVYNGNFSNISPEPWHGAYHASELSLIFGTYDFPTEVGNPTVVTAFEKELSIRMQDLWLAFMENPLDGLQNAGWPKSDGHDGLIFAPEGLPDRPLLEEVVSAESLSGVCQISA